MNTLYEESYSYIHWFTIGNWVWIRINVSFIGNVTIGDDVNIEQDSNYSTGDFP